MARNKKQKSKKSKNKHAAKKRIVAVSGGFDPVHIGHVRMFKEAKKLAGANGEVIVILNNDNWLKAKKGYAFMPQQERKEIIEAFDCVDKVILTAHPEDPADMSVCEELILVRPDIFANGGDRTNKNVPEIPVCEEIGCSMIFNIGEGGKVQSSSWLVGKVKGVRKAITK
jgi:cytidyltransferase-like protein